VAHRHGKTWRGSVTAPGVGTLRRGGFPTRAAAERWERDTAVDLARGSYRDPDAGAVNFGEWLDEWLATRGALKRSSSTAERAIVETHLRPAFGRQRVDAVGPLAVRQLVSRLLADGKAAKTVRNIHGVLYSVMALAVEQGLIESNPCTGTRLPRNARRKARSYLTEQQVEQIIAAVPDQWRPLTVVLATTGLRWGEAVGLRVKWVDLLERRLRVEETLNEAAGVLSFGTPKTEASVRTVSLPARAVDALLPLVAGKGGDELVFQTATGQPVRHRNFYTRCWVPTVTALGLLDPRPSIHDLRHAHAAILVSRGVPLTAVKERLGHESIATTDKLYAFLQPGVDEVVIGALDAAFGDPLVPQPSHNAEDALGKGL
jgi:integrase